MACCECCPDERGSLSLFLAVDATWMWIQGFRAFFGCVWEGGWWNAFVAVLILAGCLPCFVLCVRAHNRTQPGPAKHLLIYAFKNFLLSIFAFMWTMVAFGWRWPAAGLTWLLTVPVFAYGAVSAYRCSGTALNLGARPTNHKPEHHPGPLFNAGDNGSGKGITPIAIVSAQPSVLPTHSKHVQRTHSIQSRGSTQTAGGRQQTLDAARHSSHSLFKYWSPSLMSSALSTPASTMPYAVPPDALQSYMNLSQNSLVHLDSSQKLTHPQTGRPRPARRHSRCRDSRSRESSVIDMTQLKDKDTKNTVKSLAHSRSRSCSTLASDKGNPKSKALRRRQSVEQMQMVQADVQVQSAPQHKQVACAMAVYGVETEVVKGSATLQPRAKPVKTPPPPPPNKPKLKLKQDMVTIRMEDDTLDARMFTPTKDRDFQPKERSIGRRQLAAKVSFSSRENSPSPNMDMQTHM